MIPPEQIQHDFDATKREVAEKRLRESTPLHDAWHELPDRVSETVFRAMCERNDEVWQRLIDVVAEWPQIEDEAEIQYAENCFEDALRKGYMG